MWTETHIIIVVIVFGVFALLAILAAYYDDRP